MNYSDLPKLYQTHYRVSISFKYLDEKLAGWKEDQEEMGYSFYLNPKFQRGHVWTEEQQTKYVEWLLMGAQSGLDIYFNHPGWHTGYEADMYLVDGLQRITACLEYLHDRLPAFGYYRSDFEKEGYLNTIHLTFHVASLSYRDMLKWYIQLNSGGTIHTQEEIDKVKKMLDNC